VKVGKKEREKKGKPKMIGFAIVLLALWPAVASATSNVKHLDYASYSGYTQDNGVAFWKGIRFAAPPTGRRRFAGPQDPEIEFETQSALSVSISLSYTCVCVCVCLLTE
jgi:hypothetical protein